MIRVSMHITGLAIVALCSGIAGLFFLTTVNPGQASKLEFVEIYSLIFGIIFSATALFGYLIRKMFWKEELTYKHLLAAERQGLLFGIFGVSLLLLNSLSLFNFSSVISLFIIFALIEYYAQ